MFTEHEPVEAIGLLEQHHFKLSMFPFAQMPLCAELQCWLFSRRLSVIVTIITNFHSIVAP